MTGAIQYRPTLEELEAELRRIRRRNARWTWVKILLLLVATAFVGGSYMTTTYCTLMRVSGNSMGNTLQVGDVVVFEKSTQAVRGDIVAFERDGVLLLKRVIAIPGDQISIALDGTVYLNGVVINEEYLSDSVSDGGDVAYPLTVPDGKVFVIGDNRGESIDSRDNIVGLVSLDEIIGTAGARVWPVERLSGL
ncbi:MAG: signal peptidase I [Eubacteriales bacterium]|nr:signal peptidase I [Eubacteriales bacterium]